MTDEELIARLRQHDGWVTLEAHTHLTAADRIEALTKEREQWRRAAETRAEGWKISDDARIEAEIKLAKAVEALTPSGDTKAEYMGEFHFSQTMIGEDGDEVTVKTYVPWTTIKKIMAAINARANLAEIKGESHE